MRRTRTVRTALLLIMAAPGTAVAQDVVLSGTVTDTTGHHEELFPRTDTSDFVGSVRCTAPPGEGAFTGVAVELDASNQISPRYRWCRFQRGYLRNR